DQPGVPMRHAHESGYENRVFRPAWIDRRQRAGSVPTFAAQFIRICRWSQLVYKDRLAPLENALFSTLWARKRYHAAQRFRYDGRATNCYKLSDHILLRSAILQSSFIFARRRPASAL